MTTMTAATATTGRKLTDEEQTQLLALPLHAPAEIRSYARPGEGFERVVPQCLQALKEHPEVAAMLKLDVEQIQRSFDEATALAGMEANVYNLYRRAMENRLDHESDVYRKILKINRVVQNADDPTLAADFKVISDWIASTHPGAGAAAALAGPANPESPATPASPAK